MDIIYIATVLGVILVSMTVHEAMHAFTSYWLGDDTAKLQGRLTLNPIKHIDPFLTILLPVLLAISGGPIFGGAKPVPFNPDRVRYDEWGSALVAVAGPLTNLLLAFVAFGSAALVGLDTAIGQVLATATVVNLGFFVFNMLPIPPLDGSRVFYALAPEFVRRGMEIVEQFGILFIFVIVIAASSLIGGFMTESVQTILYLFTLIFPIS